MEKLTRREFVAAGSALAVTALGAASLPGCGGGGQGGITAEGPAEGQIRSHYKVKISAHGHTVTDILTGKDVGVDIPLALTKRLQAEGGDPAIKDGDEIGLAVEFDLSDLNGSGVDGTAVDNAATDSTDGTGKTTSAYSQQFPGFFVFVGRIDTHPLIPCVYQDVTHTHLTVKRYANTPDPQAWTKLHLGAFPHEGRRCFVVFDNLHPNVCIKTCIPTRMELAKVINQGLKLGFAGAGVEVSLWVASIASDVLSGALLVTMLAL